MNRSPRRIAKQQLKLMKAKLLRNLLIELIQGVKSCDNSLKTVANLIDARHNRLVIRQSDTW